MANRQNYEYDGDYPTCKHCGALVPVGGTKLHDGWHEHVLQTLERITDALDILMRVSASVHPGVSGTDEVNGDPADTEMKEFLARSLAWRKERE